MIRITPLGGFNEVGRQSVCVEIDDEVFILDLGLHLERFIELTKDDFPHKKHSIKQMLENGSIPDITMLPHKNVKAILCSHAHLDHIGAIPYLIKKLKAPIYGTPFTIEVIKASCEDRNVYPTLKKKIGKFKLGSIEAKFIPVGHSTAQSTIIALHTKEGVLIYANDYKNDDFSYYMYSTDNKRIQELQGKVKCLILDALYAEIPGRCESEVVARNKILQVHFEKPRAIFVSTFSFHISRIASLIDLGKKLNRKIVCMGRSLGTSLEAAKNAGIIDLTKEVTVLKYGREIRSFLSTLTNPEEYYILCTGHQGEPLSVLSRLSDGLFHFSDDDYVVFSCNVILPVPVNIENRRRLEEKLAKQQCNIIKGIHVSGHGHAEDQNDLIKLLQPEIVCPSHGLRTMHVAMKNNIKPFFKGKILLMDVGTSYIL